MANAVMRDRRREAEAAMRYAAFTAWLQGAGGDMAWGAFCRHYGLAKLEGEKVKDTGALYQWADKVLTGVQKN